MSHPKALLAALLLLSVPAGPAAAFTPQEPALLRDEVTYGLLPPVRQRMPDEPLVVDLEAKEREAGRSGGWIRTFITQRRNSRIAVLYGYARLVGYNDKRELVPDIAKSVAVEEGRDFTLTLRAGHRWSDGAPFTSDDIRYWWEDIANNPMLSPSGPPRFMLVNGKPPEVSFPDAVTARFRWEEPNPYFLPTLAAARPPFIYRPAHYLKQFHARYTPETTLAPLLARYKVRNWAALHNLLDDMFRMENPDEPTLQPWMVLSKGTGNHLLFQRNPYYHRFDSHGMQLPYTDGLDVSVMGAGLIPAQVATGKADLQAEGLTFSQVPVLVAGERGGNYRTLLWPEGKGAEIALYPNLNYNDPVWRALLRDVRFRRALSLTVDRRIINRSLFFGLARESGVGVLPDSPLYDPQRTGEWTGYDPQRAAALLDEIGLERPRGALYRQLPDGRPLEVIVETSGEKPEITDALQIIAETWRDIGVRLLVRTVDRDVLRNRVYAGQTMMAVWGGWDNGVPDADSSPEELAPMTQENFSWPKWGQYYQTSGGAGEAVDLPVAAELMDLAHRWRLTTDKAERRALWTRMLDIQADQVFAIGVVSETPQPIAVSNRLRNVPEKGLWLWDPGAYLGVYRPDEFFFADARPADPDPVGIHRRED
ncbi:ABC transporter substrate-binding protein [Azospirillum picis]|uniref:Peptide/nickel transport system substrate-binding protein n=1 Tax=Azospirillum picis TaxID=488438 RepID=A0ABU0MQI8_9PROT|nr:ABC transporter substrate-binding protein [Azospirillum picis]MBP2302159.1 peptide/nickel transport system substrate-binding protein [Azospirillum picis]MDQ0535738.1 peptide/nickel transport system substrate-binding protein [Azospirillum picis]